MQNSMNPAQCNYNSSKYYTGITIYEVTKLILESENHFVTFGMNCAEDLTTSPYFLLDLCIELDENKKNYSFHTRQCIL